MPNTPSVSPIHANKGKGKASDEPRGFRNNNPGNIEKSHIAWAGKVAGSDSRFETFDTMENGTRALAKNLNIHRKAWREHSQEDHRSLGSLARESFAQEVHARSCQCRQRRRCE